MRLVLLFSCIYRPKLTFFSLSKLFAFFYSGIKEPVASVSNQKTEENHKGTKLTTTVLFHISWLLLWHLLMLIFKWTPKKLLIKYCVIEAWKSIKCFFIAQSVINRPNLGHKKCYDLFYIEIWGESCWYSLSSTLKRHP